MSLDEIIAFCKRCGFIFQNSEIYGGNQGVYDYGPMGIELKNNIKASWWRSMVYERDDVEGIDSAILTHCLVLRHSGHEATFADPMVDCKNCKARMRADHMVDRNKCDKCESSNLTEARNFNLMFKTTLGALEENAQYVYLRPETAQGIFTNFKNILDTTSRKLPFGIAQIGKAFRNEINPKHFIFRVREFEQMELEFFVEPGTDEKWHSIWLNERISWWKKQGLSEGNLKLHQQNENELSHYSKSTFDILYKFPHGFEELEGVANRTDFDLGSHTKAQSELNITAKVMQNSYSNTKLVSNDIVPFIIEPSAGLDRGVLAILTEAYHKEKLSNDSERIVLKLKPHLAPIKIAVIPLAKNNNKIVEKAMEIANSLRKLGIGRIKYEDIGNVGKAYRRNDEIGTPCCITVDFETFEGEEETVTIRDRDSMEQSRINVKDIENHVKNLILY